MNEFPESVICGQRFKVGIIVGKEPVFLVQLDGFLQVFQSIVGIAHGKLCCCHGVIDVVVVLFGKFQSPGIVSQSFVVPAVIVVKDTLVENLFRCTCRILLRIWQMPVADSQKRSSPGNDLNLAGKRFDQSRELLV